jgi:hypothetical protein
MKAHDRKHALRNMADVLGLFSTLELVQLLDVPYQTAWAMQWRGWADPIYFVDLVDAVTERDLVLTYEMLCRWTKDRGLKVRPKSPPPVRRTARRSSSPAAPGPPL